VTASAEIAWEQCADRVVSNVYSKCPGLRW